MPEPTHDPDFERWVSKLPLIREEIERGIQEGRPWYAAITVREVAAACQMTPDDVVDMIDKHGFLVGINKGPEPIGGWTVFEDGE